MRNRETEKTREPRDARDGKKREDTKLKDKIQIQNVGGKDLESGDARDVEKRDSEKWRSPVTLWMLGTWKKEKILKKKTLQT